MSALDDFPGELSIVAHRGGWKLLIHGPYLAGEVTSPHRARLESIAEAYGQIRAALGPRRPAAGFTALYFAENASEAHLCHPLGGLMCDVPGGAGTDETALRGTGSHAEREFAAGLPACRACTTAARRTRAAR